MSNISDQYKLHGGGVVLGDDRIEQGYTNKLTGPMGIMLNGDT